jgi:hypothetical protein
MHCLQQAVLAVESSFELAPDQRKRTLYRLDGGSGTDENLRWLLARGYQVVGKGFSGKRANALATHVSRWDIYDDHSWLGWVNPTFDRVMYLNSTDKSKALQMAVAGQTQPHFG